MHGEAAGADDVLSGRLLCHVNLARGFRGGERQTQLLIESFAARGYRQRLLARKGAPLVERCRGIDQLEIRATSPQPLVAAMSAKGCDLLHAHEARAIYTCWLASRFSSKPWLLTRRVDNPFKRSLLRDRAYRQASAVVGVSTRVQRQIEDFYPGLACVVVADAHANLAEGHAMSGTLRSRFQGKAVIGHIGALDHSHKGQGTIIEIARLAKDRHPEWHFVLVGDGCDEAAFRQSASNLDNVEFAGYVNNVADWLAVFDLFIFPSLHEGLGSTLLDAMSFGLAVVASRVGGIPDIVQDGANGLLVAPEQPAEMFSAIERILSDESLLARLRRGALEQAARYDPDAMADRYAALYRRLLPNR